MTVTGLFKMTSSKEGVRLLLTKTKGIIFGCTTERSLFSVTSFMDDPELIFCCYEKVPTHRGALSVSVSVFGFFSAFRYFSRAVGIGRSAIEEIWDSSLGVLDTVKARRFSRTSGSSSTLT